MQKTWIVKVSRLKIAYSLAVFPIISQMLQWLCSTRLRICLLLIALMHHINLIKIFSWTIRSSLQIYIRCPTVKFPFLTFSRRCCVFAWLSFFHSRYLGIIFSSFHCHSRSEQSFWIIHATIMIFSCKLNYALVFLNFVLSVSIKWKWVHFLGRNFMQDKMKKKIKFDLGKLMVLWWSF